MIHINDVHTGQMSRPTRLTGIEALVVVKTHVKQEDLVGPEDVFLDHSPYHQGCACQA